jgi:hypothetical protein
MPKAYSLLSDPLFYIMLGFFALLTTVLAAGLGQPRFLPISQSIVLFAFLTVALRRGLVRPALYTVGLWLIVQIGAMIGTTMFAPQQSEQAIADGFAYRTSLNAWLYGVEALPAGLVVAPRDRLFEIVGILVGSLVSGGLVGLWFLMRAVNLVAYGAGALWQQTGSLTGLLAGLPLWSLLRLAGYAGFVILLAEPFFTGNWRLHHYWTERRRLLLASTLLLILGLLLELILPGVWRTLLASPVS